MTQMKSITNPRSSAAKYLHLIGNLGSLSLARMGIFAVVFACAGASVSVLPQGKVTSRKEVKVYFYHDPGEYIDLAPVKRSVNASAPARPSIEALLKGPTAAERHRGFGPLASASEFRSAH